MNLIERARRDAKRIINNDANGFGIPISIWTTNADDEKVEIELIGTAKRHSTQYDEYGNVVNATNVSCTISIADLEAKEYPFKKAGEIHLKGHHVEFSDAQGHHDYVVAEWLPDEYLGIIVLILSE